MLAALFVICVSQEAHWKDTLGKSGIQILHMGRDSWCALFYEKYGSSNSSHANALYAYALAVARVNNKLLSDPKLPHQAKTRKLADLVVQFAFKSIALGESIDFNTGWLPVGNGLYADAEATVYVYLRPDGSPRAKSMVVSQVRKALDAQSSLVKDALALQSDNPKRTAEIKSDYAELYKIYHEMVPLIAATTGRTGSDRILGFCLRAVETISY